MAQTQPRQNFHMESEAGINRQINMELYASYTYQSMLIYLKGVQKEVLSDVHKIEKKLIAFESYYFDRDDVALPGFAKYFCKASSEEREHAEKLMKYQNKRGGRIVLQDIKKPDRDEWGTGLDAMQVALQLEKSVNQSLLDLHKVADGHGDAQFMDFIESEYLEEQVNAIKEISDHVTQLKRVGSGLGEYEYDRRLDS